MEPSATIDGDMYRFVDLNCDVGESFGHFRWGDDAEILKYVTSASIACGFHAGDPSTMRATVVLALENGVAIGAHPGLPDLVGFGRRMMAISPRETRDLVVYQIGALAAIAKSEGATMGHVKPHGALYNMAAKDRLLALAIAEGVARVDPTLVLFGQSGSQLIATAQSLGLRTASEVFADRTYEHDGSLTPRDIPNSLIADSNQSIRQVLEMVQSGKVRSRQGTGVDVRVDTICLHGDRPNAAECAKNLRSVLEGRRIVVRSFPGK